MDEISVQSLHGIRSTTDPKTLKAKSQDFCWFSPMLHGALKDKIADAMFFPKDETEISRIVSHAVGSATPIVVRGGGTGNYGQCVPLAGGIVIDLQDFNAILAIGGYSVTAQSGILVNALRNVILAQGKELRLYPSTQRLSSIGGFVGGGAGGVGSVNWGLLAEPGNVLGARIMTVEAVPRIIPLRGDDVALFVHAYGTTGIILDVELPLAPAYPWVESLYAFDEMASAVCFSRDLAEQNGVLKRDIATIQTGIPEAFRPLQPWLRPGESIALVSTTEGSEEAMAALAASHGAQRRFRMSALDLSERHLQPNYEYGWNHATLNFLRMERNITYIQCGYQVGREIECVAALDRALGQEVRVQLQWVRLAGTVTCFGLHIVRYSTPERLREIAAVHREIGISVSNCHSFQCEAGEDPTPAHLRMAAFKQIVDPQGLLNPGKLGCAVPPDDGVGIDPGRMPVGFIV